MSTWAAAMRIARREARKSRGRSGLVLAMIALPVAVLSFAVVNFDMFALTDDEVLQRRIGRADALVAWVAQAPLVQHASGSGWMIEDGGPVAAPLGLPPSSAEVLAYLPPGSRVVVYGQAHLRLRGPLGLTSMQTKVLDVADPVTRGIVEVVAGRAPGAGEVAMSRQAARELELDIGDTLRSVNPERDFKVVGLVEFPGELRSLLVFNDYEMLPSDQAPQWLVDSASPLTALQVQRLNDHGLVVTSHEYFGESYGRSLGANSAEGLAIGFLAGGLVTLEIVLLAGPAFAVGARRRARDLALIAAAGGAPKHLRRVVLADGVVLGVCGAGIGLLLGVSAAVAGRPLVEEYIQQARAGGWRFYPTALTAIALLAVGTGLLAAMVPAFIAARQDVVQVLNGRRGVLRSRRRWIAVGLSMVAIGTMVAVFGASITRESLILLGIVLTELGLVVLTPSLVGLIAKVGRWLPLAARLALRDTARNRTAAAPAISAIMAAVAGAVAVGVFLAGTERQQATHYEPYLPMGHFAVHDVGLPVTEALDWEKIEAAVRRAIPTAEMVTMSAPVCPERATKSLCEIAVLVPEASQCTFLFLNRELTPQEMSAALADDRCVRAQYGDFRGALWIPGSLIDDGDALKFLTGASDADVAAARQVLAAGGAVVTDSRMMQDGKLRLARMVGDSPQVDPLTAIDVPAYHLASAHVTTRSIISTAAAARLAMQTEKRSLVGAAGRMPTAEQEDLLQRELAEASLDVYATVERGPLPVRDPTMLLLAVAAAVIALGAAGIATGLAMVDSRADLATLAAVGAAPRMRRTLSLARAGIISGLGALLGTLAGLGGAAVLVFALNQVYARGWPTNDPVPFVIPWQSLAVIVAVPLVAMAGAALFTRARLPIERRF